jgi:hypothetical protein
LLGLAPVLFFQTAIHEGSHCVIMTATGLGCRVTAPFAVSWGDGRRAYGVTFAVLDEATSPPILMVIAPQIAAALLIVVLRLVAPRVTDERWAILLRVWLLGACVDLLNNTGGRSPGGDWAFMANEVGLTEPQRLALSLPLWLLIAWGLFAPVPGAVSPRGARFRDLWEIGVVYALISAAAVFASTTVRVPGDDPTTLWHRVPILLQAASVAVCLALVAWARVTRREAV